jgi:hypothetical protein
MSRIKERFSNPANILKWSYLCTPLSHLGYICIFILTGLLTTYPSATLAYATKIAGHLIVTLLVKENSLSLAQKTRRQSFSNIKLLMEANVTFFSEKRATLLIMINHYI